MSVRAVCLFSIVYISNWNFLFVSSFTISMQLLLISAEAHQPFEINLDTYPEGTESHSCYSVLYELHPAPWLRIQVSYFITSDSQEVMQNVTCVCVGNFYLLSDCYNI